ncbi:MAG: hypothetical protein EXS14_04990 [Planctomycetes bacterium]|nr:hypothetical protein [Planctomycetota bacterium]
MTLLSCTLLFAAASALTAQQTPPTETPRQPAPARPAAEAVTEVAKPAESPPANIVVIPTPDALSVEAPEHADLAELSRWYREMRQTGVKQIVKAQDGHDPDSVARTLVQMDIGRRNALAAWKRRN